MSIVSRWLEERSKKKSVTEPRNQTTNVSSPLRGANQDYSGVGVKNDNADYTISDEHKHPNLNVPPHQPEWEIETKATRKAISKNLIKTTSKGVYGEETINELVSGVSNVRIKPVNMAQSTGGSGSANAPSNTKSLQTASNIRVSQLDRAAQQQKDQSKKDQEKQIADREKAAAQRQKESQKQMKESNMKTFKDFSQLNEATRMDIIKTASKQAAIKAGVKVTPPKKPAKENPIKLREEDVEQINEISTKTLVSYSQKAHKQVKGNQPSDPDKLRKRTNREQGIKLAFNKHYQFKAKVPATVSTNEEVERVIEAKEDNPNTGNGRDPRQHIQVQAGRAMAGVPVDFKHDNGETSKLTAPMGRKIVSHLNGLKPADRQAAVSKMHASPAGLKV